ncbi:MAG: transposase [Candidatus Omnitrophica bacterium]|nr:transposase [Candidatus Omnitrophota bacterium]
MPRTARYIEVNGYYHIISRSINETWILKDKEDFDEFLKLIHEAKLKYTIRLFHYVLMNTHFHLVAQALKKQDFQKNIAHIKWHYTQWMKRKYHWKGPLWRERFKSLPIENEHYLTSCGIYVEYNPVRAAICTDPAQYPYSSYQKYEFGKKDTLIDEYHCGHDAEKSKSQIYQSEFSKTIFSQAPAIGSSSFLNIFKKSKKCLSQK